MKQNMELESNFLNYNIFKIDKKKILHISIKTVLKSLRKTQASLTRKIKTIRSVSFNNKVVSRRPLRYNGESMGTWQNPGDRATLKSYLTTNLTTLQLIWRPFSDLAIMSATIFDEFGTLWILLEIRREIH
ncbi:UNVERIFIED_CONTAM: hypothetical protein NCL1_29346 [Trichonephila clavipes]